MGPRRDNPYTLHAAMSLVLREHGGSLHAKELACEIAERNLYLRKDGQPAPASQIRWRASRYPAEFSWGDGAIWLRGVKD